MWVFWIRFIYMASVCKFASKLCSLLWFCGCVLFLHHVIFEILRFCYVGIWTLTSTWGICKWMPFKNFKSYFFLFCFVGLLWFRGFVFIISSEFHRLFIKVLVLFAIGFFVIDLYCSILFNLSNFGFLKPGLYVIPVSLVIQKKKKKKKSAFVSY